MDPSTGGQSIELFYHKGSSDKIYCLSVEASGGDFVVNFAYGRRGTKLRHGTKTLAPVSLSKAQQIYDGVIAEKTAEGYVPEAGALPLTVTQTKDGQNFVREFVREIQEELWSRNYGHSWGVRDEFTALIRAHPELLNLSVKEASDLILANLSIWSPVLAAKEATAMARYVSPEQVKANEARRDQLMRAIKNKIVVGPADAEVFICDFDSESEPGIKPGIWAVFSMGWPLGVFESQEKAMLRAREAVERAFKVDVSISTEGGRSSITISGSAQPDQGSRSLFR